MLTRVQRAAVRYVTDKSRKDSKAVYSKLKQSVIRLGYSEKDLTEYVYVGYSYKWNLQIGLSILCAFLQILAI